MIEAAETAREFFSGRTRNDLDSDRMLVFALVRAIEIVGEAASKVTGETREAAAEIPWSLVVSMRNRLIHACFDVDYRPTLAFRAADRTRLQDLDEAAGRYRDLRCGQIVNVCEDNFSGLLVRPKVALAQQRAETSPSLPHPPSPAGRGVRVPTGRAYRRNRAAPAEALHGSVVLDAQGVGRDAGRIADEVIAHLAGMMGASVRVTLEIEAEIEAGLRSRLSAPSPRTTGP
jgi:uncharacterized protein with HEPN domain